MFSAEVEDPVEEAAKLMQELEQREGEEEAMGKKVADSDPHCERASEGQNLGLRQIAQIVASR